MFAALRLIELGIKPIFLERGKDVQTRRKDLRAIQQFGEVNPDSNYCFGEGGPVHTAMVNFIRVQLNEAM